MTRQPRTQQRPQRRPRGRLSECRDCADPIVFALLDTGSRIPLNPLPDPAGNVAARAVGGRIYGYVVSASKPLRVDHTAMMPHAATCRSRPRPQPATPAPLPPEPDTPLF